MTMKKTKDKKWEHLRFPSDRHFLNSLSKPKMSGNSLFVIEKEDVRVDLKEIHSMGDSVRDGGQFTVSSGRIYSFHDDILYPVSGPGIVNVTSKEYNILVQFRKHPENAAKSLAIMESGGIFDQTEAARVRYLMNLMKMKKDGD